MGRLIDADEFKKRFGYSDADSEEEKLTNMTIRRMINSQPTAYDVENVVKDIQDIGTRFCVSVHCNNECDCCDHGSIMKSIIEIVRNGGVK